MIQTLNYEVKLYDIINNNEYIMSNIDGEDLPETPYELNTFYITNNIFDPLQNTATIRLTFNPAVASYIVSRSILGGNVVQITEVPSDSESRVVFVGYIASFEIDQIARGIGTTVTLNCNSILYQLSKQLVVNQFNDMLTLLGDQVITDWVENKAPLGQILKFMTTQSLLTYVTKNNIVPFSNVYQGTLLPFNVMDNAGIGLDIESDVYYYASTNDDRLTSLLRTIEAYQMIIYQDLDGTINITQPNINQNNQYTFNVGNYVGTTGYNFKEEGPYLNSMLFKSFSYINKSGDVANRTYASLAVAPINFSPDNGENQISYAANIEGDLFVRSKELKDSGIFEISDHDIIDFSENIVRNPILSEVLVKSQNGNLIINSVSGNQENVGVTGIYAAKLLAKDLFDETQINITMARLACVNDSDELLPIPFGKTITLNDNGALAFDTNAYYCYGFDLSYQGESSGTELLLRMCKPYTMTTVWTNIND